MSLERMIGSKESKVGMRHDVHQGIKDGFAGIED